jgi:hypothetical protein
VLVILEILHLLLPIVTARHHGSHLLNLIVILSGSTNRTVDTVSRMNEIYIEVAQVNPLTHSLTHSLTYSLTHLLTHSLTYLLTYLRTYALTHSVINQMVPRVR